MQNKYAPDVRDACLSIFYAYEQLGEKNYVDYLFLALKETGIDGEVLCKIGDFYMQNKDFYNAEKYYELALNADESKCKGFVKKEFYYLYPLLQLTVLNYKKGDIDRSRYYHNLCMQKYSNDKRVKHNEQFFNKCIKE